MSAARLFEDPYTDARMRRTIPRFACLGAGAVVITAPFATESNERRLLLVGLAAIAVLVAGVVSWRGVIERLARDVIFGLLFAYCIIIAFAVAATNDSDSAYFLFYVIPTIFGSVFFQGWVRYSIALAAAVVDFVIVGSFIPVSVGNHVVSAVVGLLVAHFGAAVADLLRDALRANRSLHSVLEAASGNPLASDLANIGVEAALSVAGWDAAAVGLQRDGLLLIPAVRGLSPEVLKYYVERPDQLVESSIAKRAIVERKISQYPDLRAVAGDDHPLVRDGLVSLVVIPMTFGADLVGVLLVGHRSERHLETYEGVRLTDVAEQLGLALGSAAAYRREMEVAEHLRELNQQKDEFLANVSHELRTPAAAIQLVATTLHRSWDRIDEGRRTEMYETLARRAAQLTELIGNLLDQALADGGATRLSVVDIEWRAAVTRWAEVATLETGRAIELRLPDDPLAGRVDAVKLERVVVNLLSNAAKFSPPDSPIVLTLGADGSDVELTVADHGIGIAPDELPKIFDRFHQVDSGTTRTVGGFGIGLSLAKHFVTVHGGTVSVESQPGHGSTFTVRIPRQPAAVRA